MTKLAVAVVGATGLIGEALISLLAEGALGADTVYALDAPAAAGKRVEFGDTRLRVVALPEFDFSTVQIAFFCVPDAVAAQWVPPALAAGCSVIDWSDSQRGMGLATPGRYVAAPSPLVHLLASVVRPLVAAAGIQRLDVSAVLAVSERGRAGVKELAGQTARLLNVQSFEAETFPAQIAFNVLPLAVDDTDITQLADLLDSGAAAIQLSCVIAPVFFGHTAQLRLTTSKPLSGADAQAILAGLDGVELVKTADAPLTPVSYGANQDEIFVGGVSDSTRLTNTLEFWLVADNVRCGAALNGIQIAGILVKDLQ